MAEPATSSKHQRFTEQAASQALTRSCQELGLDVKSVELVRMGSNAVFRLDDDIVARVAPSTSYRGNAQKQIEVSRWLESIDYPAVRAIDLTQPAEAAGRVITFWKSVAATTAYAPVSEVAGLIKRLHTLTPPPDLRLPALNPFGEMSDRLPDLPGLRPADARYLCTRIEWARSAFPTLPFVLPAGVIHGDANVGNVLVDDAGNPVLIDLDSFSIGPREWDLIQTALFYDRLGWHSHEEYQTFVDVYGFDIMQWSGYSDLADMREIAMTTWLSRKASESEDAATEAGKRIRAIRGGSSRRDWGPY